MKRGIGFQRDTLWISLFRACNMFSPNSTKNTVLEKDSPMIKHARWLSLIILLSALLGMPKQARAGTINAASCSQTDVASAVSRAVAGDTVALPSCSQTNWTSTLQVN